MPKKNEIFERLAQSARARDYSQLAVRSLFEPSDRLLRREMAGPDTFAPGTLERLAFELRLPTDVLIEQFARAGVTELQANDRVSESAKKQLLAFLRWSHGACQDTPNVLYRNSDPPLVQIELLQDANEELIRALAADPVLMYRLNPRKFEELVALLFVKRGFEVTLTPPSKDGGFDFFARLRNPMTSFLVVGECKRYARDRRVGVEVVRSLHSVAETRGAHQGLVITSAFFTAGAVEYQKVLGAKMGLRDYDDLVGWLNESHV